MPGANKKVTAPDGKAVVAVRVEAKVDGFRRAGRAWSKAPTVVPIDEFDDNQLKALQAEPNLVVTLVEEGAEDK
jgi:hypothetical protein